MKIEYQKELVKIKKIIDEKPRGVTIKEISKKIGVNRNVVAKYLDVLQIQGQIEIEKFGRSKVYFPSHSVPLSTMFDFSYELIIVVGENMNIVEINSPFIKYLGLLKKDKLIGKPVKTLSIVKSYPKMTGTILEVLDKKQIYEDKFEYRKEHSKTPDHFQVKFIPTTLRNGESGVTIILYRFNENE